MQGVECRARGVCGTGTAVGVLVERTRQLRAFAPYTVCFPTPYQCRDGFTPKRFGLWLPFIHRSNEVYDADSDFHAVPAGRAPGIAQRAPLITKRRREGGTDSNRLCLADRRAGGADRQVRFDY